VVRGANPRCRFLYLMGHKSDGTINILVDSEPPESDDYSPPGQTYDEASAELRALFVRPEERVQGPHAVTGRQSASTIGRRTPVPMFIPLGTLPAI